MLKGQLEEKDVEYASLLNEYKTTIELFAKKHSTIMDLKRILNNHENDNNSKK